jgi:hypothetical protein
MMEDKIVNNVFPEIVLVGEVRGVSGRGLENKEQKANLQNELFRIPNERIALIYFVIR